MRNGCVPWQKRQNYPKCVTRYGNRPLRSGRKGRQEEILSSAGKMRKPKDSPPIGDMLGAASPHSHRSRSCVAHGCLQGTGSGAQVAAWLIKNTRWAHHWKNRGKDFLATGITGKRFKTDFEAGVSGSLCPIPLPPPMFPPCPPCPPWLYSFFSSLPPVFSPHALFALQTPVLA